MSDLNIHPQIKNFQERVNRIYKEWDVHEEVQCFVNLQIFLWNQKRYLLVVQSSSLCNDEKLLDTLYHNYNKWHTKEEDQKES